LDSIKKIISNVIIELQSPEKKKRQDLLELWPSIAGPKISSQTKPVLGREGRLTVWVSQSVLAFELKQKYQQSLLKRAQAALGEKTVTAIYFRVGQIR